MSSIQVKPINGYDLLCGREKGKNLTEGTILSQDSVEFVIKTDKYKTMYSFLRDDFNDKFVITKENKLVFTVFEKFFNQLVQKYCAEVSPEAMKGTAFGGKKVPKDFITKDDKSITFTFRSENYREGKGNVISFVYEKDNITINMDTKDNEYKGVDIKVNESNYLNFYQEINNLLINLNALASLQNTLRVGSLQNIMTISNEKNVFEISKNKQNLIVSQDDEGISINMDSDTFEIANNTNYVKESKMYFIFANFIKKLESKKELNKGEYAKISNNNGVLTYTNFSGDSLIMKYDNEKIIVSIRRAKVDEDMLALMKTFGEEDKLVERKITVSSQNESFQNLYNSLMKNFGVRERLERRR